VRINFGGRMNNEEEVN